MSRTPTRPRLEPLEDRRLLAGIYGALFNDLDGDGLRGPAEPGLAGRTVFLDTDGDGRHDAGERSALTAADGGYSFADTGPGTFTVCQLLPAGWHAAGDAAAGPGTAAERLLRLDAVRSDPRFAGIDGSGFSVAVLDTGFDASHPALAGAFVHQHDYLDDDDIADDPSGHGTHVASLIAGRDEATPGVAPGAGLVGLKVLDAGGGGNFSHIEDGLRWVIDHAAEHKIVSVNLSLGDGGSYAAALSLHGIGDELAELEAMGVVVVAAAGNAYTPSHAQPGVAYPAADPNVVAVGAVWDSDRGGPWSWGTGAIDNTSAPGRIVSFSQRGGAGSTQVFAPGTFLIGASPGGGVNALSGTSMAAGIVAGLVPLAQQLALRDLGRTLTADEVRTLLHDSGAVVIDGDDEDDNVANTGLAYRRVDALSLLESVIGVEGVTGAPLPQAKAVHVLDGDVEASLGSMRPGRVRGVVYQDSNGNGRRDATEAAAAGRTVYLDRNNNGRLDAGDQSAVTDALGRYTLDDLALGPAVARLLTQPGEAGVGVDCPIISGLDRGIDFGVRAATGNRAPELLGNGRMPSVDEDAAPGQGVTVGEMLGATFRDADVGSRKGIAVVGVQGPGRWHYSTNDGATWTDFYNPSVNGARLLRAEDRIRFVPARDGSGGGTLTYHGWDQTVGAGGGSTTLTGRTGGAAAFSATSAIVQCVIRAANDAPVLLGPGTLPAGVSDGMTWPAVRVSDLLAGKVKDADGAVGMGMAVEGFTGDGRWQYSRDGGRSYTDIGTLAAGQARLLEDHALLRFVPRKGSQGAATISYRAWDRSAGRAGLIGAVGELSATSPFSLLLATATMQVRKA